MTKKISVYIAGPITGIDGFEENFRAAASLLERNGYDPVDPTTPGQVEGYTYKQYIDRGLAMLQGCDAICMLPGSDASTGALLEKCYALAVGLDIYKVSDDYTRVIYEDPAYA